MTANVVITAQREHTQFCFIVKPAPGSRRVNILGYQQLHEIEQMLFVTNNHVLLKFRGGKAVTLMSNGSSVPQTDRVQRILEENATVVGESQIFNSQKTVLIKQEYGEDLQFERYVALKFSSDGLATVVGIFDKPVEQMKKKMVQYSEEQANLFKRFPSLLIAGPSLVKNLVAGQNALLDTVQEAIGNQIINNAKLKIKIKYAKEFFVTEKGEVIKMAAIVS